MTDVGLESEPRIRALSAAPGVWVNNLKSARERIGLKQMDIACAVGIGQTTVASIEKGHLSGRDYMDSITDYLCRSAHVLGHLGFSPEHIFPYYGYITYTQAADILGVSSTLVSRRVEEGVFTSHRIGSTRLLLKSEVESVGGESLRRRSGQSYRQRVSEALNNNGNGGMTSEQLLIRLGPYQSLEEANKRRKSIQVILSRGREFTADKSRNPARWTVNSE